MTSLLPACAGYTLEASAGHISGLTFGCCAYPQSSPISACRVLEAAELLRSYALSRGWVAASGLPDETRSGRQILKDFVNGKLLHCERPPACALSNTQLGLTGQTATASKHAGQTQAGTAALEADQVEAQISGDSHSHSEGACGSGSDAEESSDQGANGAESSQEGSAAADDAAAVSSSSDTEASAAAHTARLNDADRELLDSMSNVQGEHRR